MSELDFAAILSAYANKSRQAAKEIGTLPRHVKDRALLTLAGSVESGLTQILQANAKDVDLAMRQGVTQGRLDRLRLDEARVRAMAQGLRDIAALPDPVGLVDEVIMRPNGLSIERIRVPFGVIGMIYEARPNVTVDAAGLAFKTGNAALLRGGSEALRSNEAISECLRSGLRSVGLPSDAIVLIAHENREIVDHLIRARKLVDLVIPRGGAELIQRVVEGAQVPVIETGVGNCHVYVDEWADLSMAQEIVINAKTQRPSVCNAIETLLLHEGLNRDWARSLITLLQDLGVEVRACQRTKEALWGSGEAPVELATDEDFATEYLDLVLAVKTVSNLEEALEHIEHFGTRHSEAIVTNDTSRAQAFLTAVDAAVVYHNASTRFTDGYEFGFGAEIGISTQKLHARGPMGLTALTTYKYQVRGGGQVRK